jgi:hypothetical protein
MNTFKATAFSAVFIFLSGRGSVAAQNISKDIYGQYENYRTWGSPIFSRLLTLKKDSFSYKTDYYDHSSLEIKGKYRAEKDSIFLFKGNAKPFATFVTDSNHENLLLVKSPDLKITGGDSLFADTYRMMESYYPDGKTKTFKKLYSSKRATGALSRYDLFFLDTAGYYTLMVPVEDGLNNGRQYFYALIEVGKGYIMHPNGLQTYETLYDNRRFKNGKWHHGKKVGKWKYYSKEGMLTRTEYYKKGQLLRTE